MGLGGGRYRPLEILAVMAGLMALCAFGIWLLNEPYDPAARILPRIYFSDDWRWEPGVDLKPRREVWGGLLLALLGLIGWLRWAKRDPLAPRLALWAMLGGAIGFPLGQSLQAFHAWNPEIFRSGFWVWLDPHMNWWNWMETTFGAAMGGTLGLGLWLNRARIAVALASPEAFGGVNDAAAAVSPRSLPGCPLAKSAPTDAGDQGGAAVPLPGMASAPGRLRVPVELALIGAHTSLLALAEWSSLTTVEALYDFGLVLACLPMIAVAGGRWAPFLVMFPVTLLPIAGKSLQAALRDATVSPAALAWLALLILPLAVAFATALILERRAGTGRRAVDLVRPALLVVTWLYFGLNFAFFHFPWPWAAWTTRTPNAIAFTVCAFGLTWLALRPIRTDAGAKTR
jgi:hypothetical protein